MAIATKVGIRLLFGADIWLKESISTGIIKGNIITADIGAEFFKVERLPLRQLMKFMVRDVKNSVMVRFARFSSILFSEMMKGADRIIGRLLMIKLFKILASM